MKRHYSQIGSNHAYFNSGMNNKSRFNAFLSFVFGFCLACFLFGLFYLMAKLNTTASVNSEHSLRDALQFKESSHDQNEMFDIQPYLVTLIFSAPKNVYQRSTIRSTWLTLVKDTSKNGDGRLKHYFVIGTFGLNSSLLNIIHREQDQFGDLLLLTSLKDSYGHLTDKLKQSFRFVANNVKV